MTPFYRNSSFSYALFKFTIHRFPYLSHFVPPSSLQNKVGELLLFIQQTLENAGAGEASTGSHQKCNTLAVQLDNLDRQVQELTGEVAQVQASQ